MAILDWDTAVNVVPDTCEFGISYNTLTSTSPFTGNTQTVSLPGAKWRMRLSFSNLEPDESRKLIGFLTAMRGSYGRFYCYDFGQPSPRGTASGSLRVRTTTSKSSVTIENTSSQLVDDDAFEIGDYIQIGSLSDRELKMIVGVPNDSSGVFEIEPPLLKRRETTPIELYVGESITYTKAQSVFMLTTDEQSSWTTRSRAYLTDIDIEAIEMNLPAGL